MKHEVFSYSISYYFESHVMNINKQLSIPPKMIHPFFCC